MSGAIVPGVETRRPIFAAGHWALQESCGMQAIVYLCVRCLIQIMLKTSTGNGLRQSFTKNHIFAFNYSIKTASRGSCRSLLSSS